MYYELASSSWGAGEIQAIQRVVAFAHHYNVPILVLPTEQELQIKP